MSPPRGRPKEGSLPLGGKARSAKGARHTSAPAKGYGSFGPQPWRQTSWDIRAAGNFIGGGMGGGLLVFAALSGASGLALSALLLAGLGLIAAGLVCVALELGRPLRAIRKTRPIARWRT